MNLQSLLFSQKAVVKIFVFKLSGIQISIQVFLSKFLLKGNKGYAIEDDTIQNVSYDQNKKNRFFYVS